MCATFQLAFDENIFDMKNIANQLTEKYGSNFSAQQKTNFFPKGNAPVIGKNNKVSLLRWGFPMANSSKVVFNARSDSLEKKPMFNSILSNRCIVPATCYYEWGTVNNKKAKFTVAVNNLPLFYMAALWEKVQRTDEVTNFCFTIITTEPNEEIINIHNRMPAILTPQTAQDWLSNVQRCHLFNKKWW